MYITCCIISFLSEPFTTFHIICDLVMSYLTLTLDLWIEMRKKTNTYLEIRYREASHISRLLIMLSDYSNLSFIKIYSKVISLRRSNIMFRINRDIWMIFLISKEWRNTSSTTMLQLKVGQWKESYYELKSLELDKRTNSCIRVNTRELDKELFYKLVYLI